MRAVNSHQTSREIRTAIPAHEGAPAVGRGLIDEFRDRLSDQGLHEAKLLMSEVVTDAVRHDGDQIDVEIRGTEDEIRVEVVGRGSGLGGTSSNGSTHDGGWGSLILDRVADDWGVEQAQDRTVVWFRISPLGRRPGAA